MKLNEFREFLECRIIEIERTIETIELKIKSLPKPENIKLSTYGNIKTLRKSYPIHKKSFLKRIIGPTKKEIQKEIHNQELDRLKKELKKALAQLEELKATIKSIKDNELKNPLSKNTETIKELLFFSTKEQLSGKETLDMLVYLCKKSRTPEESVEDKITHNITFFYDDSLKLKKGSKISTLELLFNKLFQVIFSEKEYGEVELLINAINIELELLKNSSEITSQKDELLKRQQSIIELQKYIFGNRIIKTHENINEFSILLKNSGINEKQATMIKASMVSKIAEEQEKKNNESIKKLMSELLNGSELEHMKKAKKLLATLEPSSIKIILERTYQDIISLFRYLNYIIGTSEYAETAELITPKIRRLILLINNIEHPTEKKNVFYYMTDSHNIPIILRNLESIDITQHAEITLLLNGLAHESIPENFIFQKDKIDFYEVSGDNISIIYSKRNNERIIICIDSKTNLKTIINRVNETLINSIKKIYAHKKTQAYASLHKTYENLVMQALDLNYTNENIYLHQKKKD